jgi:tRNA threonylcarbamoyladenosine biosynthesis protein TsaE
MTNRVYECWLPDEVATVRLGALLGEAAGSEAAGSGLVIYMEGELGAGKTTLTRGLLSAHGHQGAVKSPTFTLVEPYELAEQRVYHFDLYRLGDPEELDYLGIRDYFDDQSLCLIEWPERGAGYLPGPDLRVGLSVKGAGRQLRAEACSDRGDKVLAKLSMPSKD